MTRKDTQAVNTLSVVDRTIASLKAILSGYSLTKWADALKKATNAYNTKSHSYLMGSAPDDVKGSKELQYELDKVHGEQIKHNNDKWRQKAGKLRDSGAFRIPRDRSTWERIDAPKFSGETYNVSGFKGTHVESGDKSRSRSKPLVLYQLGLLTLIWAMLGQTKEDEPNRGRSYRTTPETYKD